MPDLPLKIMMNVGNPDRAFDFACLPNEGVGRRLEFIINRMIGVHPRALLEFDDRRKAAERNSRDDERLRLAERVLCWPSDRRDRDARGGVLSEARDRASVRL